MLHKIALVFFLVIILEISAFKLTTGSALNRRVPFSSLKMAENEPAPALPKKLFAVRYTYVENMEERRGAVRAPHLELIKEYEAAGTCVMGGAFIEPVDGGFLLFETEEAAREFVSRDPYVEAGLVPHHDIRAYMCVSGTAFNK
mmetsp:Transcript_27191/g.40615  ORF Transcript_27191/g.40615 Transcript_27191/m.40615 type:complete len:144 (-) Transcript_27191:145-576(-)